VLPTTILGAVGRITPKPVSVSGLTAVNKKCVQRVFSYTQALWDYMSQIARFHYLAKAH